MQESAPECRFGDSSENKAVQSAGECTRGADSDARTKSGDVSALRIEEAMKALAAGDVETARRLLNRRRGVIFAEADGGGRRGRVGAIFQNRSHGSSD